MKTRSIALLSGEPSTIPAAEARALFLAYDPYARFEAPEQRVLISDSTADPDLVSSRVAFCRRVGPLFDSLKEAEPVLAGKRIRFRCIPIVKGAESVSASSFLEGFDSATIDIEHPDCELTLVRGERDYLAVTRPTGMRQGWHLRRPRRRPYFHPSAIFPKLSRALVNLSRCREGGVLLDPFAGTGSIPIEASAIGLSALALDRSEVSVRGALSNAKHFGLKWLGAVRGDALSPPFSEVDAVVCDIPYGRASSTMGSGTDALLEGALKAIPSLLKAGSFAVVMHRESSTVKGGSSLSLVEEHSIYVHKTLTRTVSVLRRN